MPKRKKILMMPQEVRDELNRRLVESAFSGYGALIEWLKEQGYEISLCAIANYGKEYQLRLEQTRETVEKAKLLVQSCPDERNALNEGLIMLCQSTLFECVVKLKQVHSEEELRALLPTLTRLTRAIADLANASQSVKKYAAEVDARARLVAADVAKQAKQGGLDEHTAAQIRAKILGIVA